jgi:hypothetical protein
MNESIPPELPPLPSVPKGYSHWEYKGRGFVSEVRLVYAFLAPDKNEWSVSTITGIPHGLKDTHYAVAVSAEDTNPTLVELLQSQVGELQEALRKATAHNEHLIASRVETDRDLPPIARTEANLWQARYFEAQRELSKANKGLRRMRASADRMKTKLTALQARIETAELALGNHPDSNTDLANEISRLREENRAYFHAYTKRANGLSPGMLTVLGKEHFGNPIPQEWYAAAKRLLELVGIAYPPNRDEPPPPAN